MRRLSFLHNKPGIRAILYRHKAILLFYDLKTILYAISPPQPKIPGAYTFFAFSYIILHFNTIYTFLQQNLKITGGRFELPIFEVWTR